MARPTTMDKKDVIVITAIQKQTDRKNERKRKGRIEK
jgi:hypothetical protein